MRCPQCNTKLAKNMKYCPVCGENLAIYQQSKDKKKMQGEAYSYYDKQQRKELDERMEEEMVEPLSLDKRQQKTKMIVVATVALLAGFGAFYLLNYFEIVPNSQGIKGQIEQTSQETNIRIENIRPDYYDQGIDLLNQMTSTQTHDRAIAIGGDAFLQEMNTYSQQLDQYYQQAQSKEEKNLAAIIENVCLYSLSNDGESAFVEAMGGRSNNAQNEILQERKLWIDQVIEKLYTINNNSDLILIHEEIEKQLAN